MPSSLPAKKILLSTLLLSFFLSLTACNNDNDSNNTNSNNTNSNNTKSNNGKNPVMDCAPTK